MIEVTYLTCHSLHESLVSETGLSFRAAVMHRHNMKDLYPRSLAYSRIILDE